MTNPLTPPTVIERPYETARPVAVRQIRQISELNEQLKAKREMLKDTLENDPHYSEVQQKVKDAQAELRAAKTALKAQNSQIVALELDIKELREEKKEVQMSLFDTLTVYQTQTNSNTIEMDDGTQVELKRQYKLAKKAEQK